MLIKLFITFTIILQTNSIAASYTLCSTYCAFRTSPYPCLIDADKSTCTICETPFTYSTSTLTCVLAFPYQVVAEDTDLIFNTTSIFTCGPFTMHGPVATASALQITTIITQPHYAFIFRAQIFTQDYYTGILYMDLLAANTSTYSFYTSTSNNIGSSFCGNTNN